MHIFKHKIILLVIFICLSLAGCNSGNSNDSLNKESVNSGLAFKEGDNIITDSDCGWMLFQVLKIEGNEVVLSPEDITSINYNCSGSIRRKMLPTDEFAFLKECGTTLPDPDSYQRGINIVFEFSDVQRGIYFTGGVRSVKNGKPEISVIYNPRGRQLTSRQRQEFGGDPTTWCNITDSIKSKQK